VHNTTSNAGGAEYVITNVNPVNLSTLVGGIWVGANHDLGGGIYASLIINDGAAIVTQFGAVGDGVTNSTAAIQSAVSRLGVQGGRVHLPSGTYRCGRLNFLASNANGIRVTGDDKNASIILSVATGEQSINFYADDLGNTSSVVLEHFTVDGGGVATGGYLYRCTNVTMNNFVAKNHTGVNFEIERAYQVNVIASSYFGVAGQPCLRTSTNTISIGNGSYFNGSSTTTAVLIDEVEFGDCLSVSVGHVIIEGCSIGVDFVEDIDTSNISIDGAYFEMLAPASAIGVRVRGGLHQSITINNDYLTEVSTPILIDGVSRRSVININSNRLYRPVLLKTTTPNALGLAGWDLPVITIRNQRVEFDNATNAFDFKPVIIIDDAHAFSSLQTERIPHADDTSFIKITGRTFKKTQNATVANLMTFHIPPGGGTSYAFTLTGDTTATTRRDRQSVTGVSSANVERHDTRFVCRNTGTISFAQSPSSLSTTTLYSTFALLQDNANALLQLRGNGDAPASSHLWTVDFNCTYFT
jgi:hypothetical protein